MEKYLFAGDGVAMKRAILFFAIIAGAFGRDVLTPLPLPAGGFVKAVGLGINSKREVAGWAETKTLFRQGFVATEAGVVVLQPADQQHAAMAINEAGMIAGVLGDVAAVWDSPTAMPRPVFNGAARAYGINAKGRVVGVAKVKEGTEAYMADCAKNPCSHEPLPALGGATANAAYAINDDGVIVGASGDFAVRWKKVDDKWIVEKLPSTGKKWMREARAINAAGDIAGAAMQGCDLKPVGFYLPVAAKKPVMIKPMTPCTRDDCVTVATAVSSGGMVFGNSEGGAFRNLLGRGTFVLGGAQCASVTEAHAVNAEGIATGTALCGNSYVAFTYQFVADTKR